MLWLDPPSTAVLYKSQQSHCRLFTSQACDEAARHTLAQSAAQASHSDNTHTVHLLLSNFILLGQKKWCLPDKASALILFKAVHQAGLNIHPSICWWSHSSEVSVWSDDKCENRIVLTDIWQECIWLLPWCLEPGMSTSDQPSAAKQISLDE